MRRESESHVNFSKVIKGAHEPVKATAYLQGTRKIDGLETNLELQQPAKDAKVPDKAKSATAKDEDVIEIEDEDEGGVEDEGDEDTGEEDFSIHQEKIIFKEIGDGSGYVDEMALIALGKEGENVLTTGTWKD